MIISFPISFIPSSGGNTYFANASLIFSLVLDERLFFRTTFKAGTVIVVFNGIRTLPPYDCIQLISEESIAIDKTSDQGKKIDFLK